MRPENPDSIQVILHSTTVDNKDECAPATTTKLTFGYYGGKDNISLIIGDKEHIIMNSQLNKVLRMLKEIAAKERKRQDKWKRTINKINQKS